ncbi:MAG: hypothetical protein ABI766_08080 [Gemmatimonadales bacterium]
MVKRLHNQRGFAMEATLLYLVLLTALIGAGIASMVMVQRAGGVDYRGSRVVYAAEAAADHVMSQLATDITDGIITDPELAAITPPAVAGFTFTAPSATRVNSPVMKVINQGTYSGLYSLNQQIDIRTTASDVAGNQSTVVVSVNAQSIPLFQFGVFYEGDLEIHNGPRMDFAGWVHSNSNLYLTSGNTYFMDNVTTADSLFWRRKATSERLNGVYINDKDANAVALDFDNRSDPGGSFVTKSNASFDGRLMSKASGVTPLKLPLPAGLPTTTMVDEKDAGDDASIKNVKFAWKADLHIVVDASKLGNPGASFCTGAMVMDRGGRPVPNPGKCKDIFSGRPDAFHDGRENVGVDLFEIDIEELEDWIQNNPAPKPIDIIYITFDNATITSGSPYTTARSRSDYPAVRLVNGSELEYPLTIATDRPVYVQGDYNEDGWMPAAILGDAITFLSPNWDDADHVWNAAWIADPNLPHPFTVTGAASMSFYAAIAAGHSSTPCDVNRSAPPCNPADSAAFYGTPVTAGSLPNYGGGLENFPRFLENWSGDNMVYRGSLVSLFDSRYAMRKRWSWIGYYSPPNRDWRFDTNFRDPTKLPPGTPTVGSVIQTAFRPIY